MDRIKQPQKPISKQSFDVAQPGQLQTVAKKPKSNVKKIVTVAIILLIVIALLGLVIYLYQSSKNKVTTNLVGVNSNQYQALFLTNGQVYFGKLQQADKDTIKISDIYYLQVQQAVQPKEGDDKQAETQLIKLGEELHAPEDEMHIDRGQVLFWENLKDSGKVAEAIKQYKKQ